MKQDSTREAYKVILIKSRLAEELTWRQVAGKLKQAAEVCGIEDTMSKTSQLMQDYAEEANNYKDRIQELTNRKNETTDEERQDIVQVLKKVWDKTCKS